MAGASRKTPCRSPSPARPSCFCHKPAQYLPSAASLALWWFPDPLSPLDCISHTSEQLLRYTGVAAAIASLKGMKQDPILSLSGAIHPRAARSPTCSRTAMDRRWPNLGCGFRTGLLLKIQPVPGTSLSREESLRNSWKVQYRKRMSETIFSPGRVLRAGFSLGERELFFGSDLGHSLVFPAASLVPLLETLNAAWVVIYLS